MASEDSSKGQYLKEYSKWESVELITAYWHRPMSLIKGISNIISEYIDEEYFGPIHYYWDTVKITVVGDKEVGKSTLNVAYREGEYDTNNPPSMCDEYTLTVRVGTYAVTANIWDCPGGDEFTNIRRVMYENTDVFIVCFAVNDRETFANVTAKWLMRLRGGHMRAVKGIRPVEADPKWDYSAPVILCATKTDRRLFDENCVTTTEGETLAREINAAEYLECSAKAYLGVEHLFQAAAFVGTQKSLGTRDSGWTSELKNAYEDGWCSTM